MKSPLPPALGSVFGFPYVFAPKTSVEVHPGLIIGVNMISEGKCEVLALPISHKDPRLHEPRLPIPALERNVIGLDHQQQYVYYSLVGKFVLPEESRLIYGLRRAFIGQASTRFLREAQGRFLEFRKTGL